MDNIEITVFIKLNAEKKGSDSNILVIQVDILEPE